MSIRIIIADDHKIVRNGLRSLIEKELDIEVIAEADNGRNAVRFALELAPDVVIMDIAMPDLNGIEATRQIIAALPGTKVIALSMHADKRYVMEMLKAGASGYILKDNAYEELARAIRTALKNHTYLSPQVTETVIGDYVQLALSTNGSAFSLLSAREREVLQLLAEGSSTAQIAECLGISVKTVETYRQHIIEKLDMRSIAELTKYAIREGLTSL
jgi:two-component system, NarL family, response regulator NreC